MAQSRQRHLRLSARSAGLVDGAGVSLDGSAVARAAIQNMAEELTVDAERAITHHFSIHNSDYRTLKVSALKGEAL